MRAMLRMFADAFEDPEHYLGQPPDDAYLAALLARPDFIAVAALDGEAVVGGVVAYVLPKFERARAEAYLYDLAVAETHRRRGVATALIRALQREASARGADVVYVQADVEDGPAIALYSRLGRRAEVLHFDLDR